MERRDKLHMQEPIALVGIGCRFPGGIRGPESFWEFICNGKDAITEIPEDRWNIDAFYDEERTNPGKMYVRRAGFLENVRDFDPQFFGISPREAAYMDPQQRLLLETTWEAFEDAGIAPERLAGSRTGVFLGLFMHDYENIHNAVTERGLAGPYSATGPSATISANRISYVYDLKGPSIMVDTACSSSLVAVHLACASLRSGESEITLAAGANLMLKPEIMLALCKGSFLSPDGACKSFDARANGYVRAEGVGVLVLKRLSSALASNDRIYALIRGTSVNQDGHSEGLTVPDLEAQIALIEEALEQSGLAPAEIDYMEAHGTGTPVGDPVEALAVGTVLGRGRSKDAPCVMGSIKSNIGHTESTAGIAGVIKAALAIRHGRIPGNLHFETPNPQIQFEELKLRVPTRLEDWPIRGDKLRAASVNSFGFGGTNAHAVLQEYRATSKVSPSSAPHSPSLLWPVCLSAHSQEALRARASELADFLTNPANNQTDLADIGHTLALRYGQHSQRLCFAVSSNGELQELLGAYLAGERRPGTTKGVAGTTPPVKLAWVFSGMGQQWWAMGRRLISTQPVFRQVIEECHALFSRHTTQWSLWDQLYSASEAESRINETCIAQPAIFALQIGVAALLQSWGIQPDMVVGHSVGEVAAAYIAGVYSLEDAVWLSFHRSRLQQTTAGTGGMLAVGLPLVEVKQIIALHGERISIAAVNSSSAITLAGNEELLAEIASALESQNIFARPLKVEVPYHSPEMDAILPELASSLASLRPQAGTIPLVSTVTGRLIDGTCLDASYWVRNVREPVLFADAVHELARSGCDIFLEIGAHPVLSASLAESLSETGCSAPVYGSLKRNDADDVMMLAVLGGLYTCGYAVDWNIFYGESGKLVRLPFYPWQRQTYWRESEASALARQGGELLSGVTASVPAHPLLGSRLETVTPCWSNEIGPHKQPYLGDHCVQETVVFPAAGHVEIGLAVAKSQLKVSDVALTNLRIHSPMIFPSNKLVSMQVHADINNGFTIHGRISGEPSDWALYAGGSFEALDADSVPPRIMQLEEIRQRCADVVEHDACYNALSAGGLTYGPLFQGIRRIYRGKEEALGQIGLPTGLDRTAGDYWLHPVLLDACFQVAAVLSSDATYLPLRIERLELHGCPEGELWCHARVVDAGSTGVHIQLQICNDHGEVRIHISDLFCQVMDGTAAFVRESIKEHVYVYQWQQLQDDGRYRADASWLPSPAAMMADLETRAANLAATYRRADADMQVEPALDRTCAIFLADALRNLGWDPEPGEVFKLAELGDRLEVTQNHRKLWQRLFGFLAQDGVIENQGAEWRVTRRLATEAAGPAWRALVKQHPAHAAEIFLLGICGSRLSGFLKGSEEARPVIFADNSTLTEHFYRHSPTCRIHNHLMGEMVRRLVAALPPGKQLHILEIGGGNGALTFHILPWLPPKRTFYTFTDCSGNVPPQVQRRFNDYPFVAFRQLDLEQDPADQGFPSGHYDLVLVADVLHTTPDLRQSLSRIKQLLSPGGMLLCLETTRPSRWLDMVFGLLPEWWRFSDNDLRPDHATISGSSWKELLSSEGFREVALLSEQSSRPLEPQHSILAALFAGNTPSSQPSPEAVTKCDAYLHDLTGQPHFIELSARPWILCRDNTGIADTLADALLKCGIRPTLVNNGITPDNPDAGRFLTWNSETGDWSSLVDMSGASPENPPVFVYICPQETHEQELGPRGIAADAVSQCMAFLGPVQELLRRKWNAAPFICLVTSGSQCVDGTPPRPEQASLWNLRRVLANERPEWKVVAIDLGADPARTDINQLACELLSDGMEDEVALRKNARYVHRLVQQPVRKPVTAEESVFELQVRQRGTFNGLEYAETGRRVPGQHQLEILVKAAGINFKDIAKLTGLLDSSDSAGMRCDNLGLEVAGVVVATGPDVEDFHVGDRVMGLASHGFRSHLTVDSRAMAVIPERLSFEDAVTVPAAYTTAWLALRDLANIRPGERVLVHSASGAVGMAAINVALDAGAVVFATAGTSEKRAVVAALGAVYVGNSRTRHFAEEILQQTNGEGVDVVLNTLPAATLPASCAALKSLSGRIIDISNVYENTLALAPLRKGAAFFTFDLEQLLSRHHQKVQPILHEICRKIERGELGALPHRVFEAAEIRDAFQLMRSSRHMGKIVVSFAESPVRIEATGKHIDVKNDGTYLITGGFGGVGLAAAQWLADCGARHLVMVGRSGASSEKAGKVLSELKARGVQVQTEMADVTSAEAVAAIMQRISQSSIPLRGIIHGAMVLDDQPLERITESSLRKVLDPKAQGALNLHLATQGMDLDFFVCHSSFASMFGNPDQGNYAAANGFMEALMQCRHSEGLPGLAMCWGVLGEFGYVAQTDAIRDFFRREGVLPLNPTQIWRGLVYGLQHNTPVLGVMNVDFKKLGRYMDLLGRLPRYSDLVSGSGLDNEGNSALPPGSQLTKESLEQAVPWVVSNTLGIAPGQLDPEKPLELLGFDSLMAMELIVGIEEAVGVRMAKMTLLQGGLTTRGLIALVEEELLKKGINLTAPEACDASVVTAADADKMKADELNEDDIIAHEVKMLTDEQVDALLNSLVNEDQRDANAD